MPDTHDSQPHMSTSRALLGEGSNPPQTSRGHRTVWDVTDALDFPYLASLGGTEGQQIARNGRWVTSPGRSGLPVLWSGGQRVTFL